MVTDRLTTDIRALMHAPSRRHILRGLAGAGLALGIVRQREIAKAKKKRKRKKNNKKAKRNAFGCVSVGGFCKNDGQCCSGICQGKKDKRKCKAHGTGTCDQEGPGICSTPNPALILCNSAECACVRTTAGSNFCFDIAYEAANDCADCQTDADCEALGFPPGSACAPFAQGEICAGASCEGGMACVTPCPAAAP
jgi:hypothetical protein